MGALEKFGLSVATILSVFVIIMFVYAERFGNAPLIRLLLVWIVPAAALMLGIFGILGLASLPHAPAHLRNVKVGREVAETVVNELKKLSKTAKVKVPDVEFVADYAVTTPYLATCWADSGLVRIYLCPHIAKLWVEEREKTKNYIRHIVAHEFAHYLDARRGIPYIPPKSYYEWGESPSEAKAEEFAREWNHGGLHPQQLANEAFMKWLGDVEKRRRKLYIHDMFDIASAANNHARKLIRKYRGKQDG